MSSWFIVVGVMGIIFGLFSFLSNRKHLLSMLLSLEYMVLSMFYLLSFVLVGYFDEDYMLLFYLTVVVCEGVLGLSLMISMSRVLGGDYFSSMSLLQC
uniref:NADH-ubiquinone oxidoreductase chain 4L n=1 Tax=Eremobates cf. palpisetulosus SEM-2008 TaxID=507470 RepID=B2CKF5_9ARAC|nr:NADH dehydrogenase subunit 4L [Eremobates cf. palpisetulosus SEM-2008]ACA49843.1 NADH dehydrogenase subunit 4L [Eremobates cf. palpisetulosus SEM-2008]